MRASPPYSDLACADVCRVLHVPGPLDHKYRRGVVQVIAGSEKYPGAGVLCVSGAQRGGAGMVQFHGCERAIDTVLHLFPETVPTCGVGDALVVGPGWGVDLQTKAERTVKEHVKRDSPVIFDAGTLEIGRLWRFVPPHLRVVTPHLGEAAGLWNRLRPEAEVNTLQVQTDPLSFAWGLSQAAEATVVLKSGTTVIASALHDIRLRHDMDSFWAGVAGSGDVLAGVIGSVMAAEVANARTTARRPDVVAAASAGVMLHATAAKIAAGGSSDGHPIIASDIARQIPAAWETIARG